MYAKITKNQYLTKLLKNIIISFRLIFRYFSTLVLIGLVLVLISISTLNCGDSLDYQLWKNAAEKIINTKGLSDANHLKGKVESL